MFQEDKQKLKKMSSHSDCERTAYILFCPGCRKHHFLKHTFKDEVILDREFNYDLENPTINFFVQEKDSNGKVNCEWTLNSGKIIFKANSNHVLANTVVELPSLASISH